MNKCRTWPRSPIPERRGRERIWSVDFPPSLSLGSGCLAVCGVHLAVGGHFIRHFLAPLYTGACNCSGRRGGGVATMVCLRLRSFIVLFLILSLLFSLRRLLCSPIITWKSQDDDGGDGLNWGRTGRGTEGRPPGNKRPTQSMPQRTPNRHSAGNEQVQHSTRTQVA